MILVSTSSLDFSRITVGQNSTLPVTVFNDNASDVNITVASSDPVFVPVPTTILIPAHGSVVVNTTFTPDAEGNFSETLTIVNDDPSDLDDDIVTLLGQGIKATIGTSATELDFETVGVQDSKEFSVTIMNSAVEGLLTVSSVVSDNPIFTVTPIAFTLNPSQSRIVKITFSPTIAASEVGTITITNDSSNIPSLVINVEGEGLVPTISIDESSLVFGEVTINTSKTLGVIVSNISTEDIDIIISDVSTNNVRFKESISTFVIKKDSALEIPVIFTPVDTSAQVGKLIITSNAGVNEVDLSGEGTATSNISVSTNFINFGSVGLGDSLNKKFTISNSGVVDLNVSQIFSDNSKFVVSPLSSVIAPSAIQEITVIYTPTDPITDNGSLVIVSNDPDTPNITVNVGGEGVSPTLQTVSNLSFGNIAVGSTSNKNLLISNPKSVTLTISNATFSNSKFSTSQVFPMTINGGSVKNISISFAPDSIGTETCDLTLFSNDFDNPETVVAIDGEGTVPEISINPSSIDFGNLIVSGTRERTIIVSNLGDASLIISSITISNSVFSVPVSSFSVNPSQSYNLAITFAPTVLGSQVGTITLVNNDPDEANLVINVQGVGGKPVAAIDKTSINFGGSAINSPLTEQVIVSNSGNVDLDISNAVNPPGIFEVSPLTDIISPASTSTLNVKFTPDVAGAFIATLNIATNDSVNPLFVVNLSGAGVQLPSVRVSSTSIVFPETISGQSSSSSLGITNAGQADLTYSISIATNPIFIANPTSGTITPGNSEVVSILFTPDATGSFSTTLTLTSNDTNNSPLGIELSGTATTAILAWEDFSLDEIVPQSLIDIANRLSEIIGPITDALAVINSLLNIIKAFIIDVQDPVKLILEAIKALLTSLINDIASTGLYFLQIFPGSFKIGPDTTEQYFRNVPIDLSDPSALPTSIAFKYKEEIDTGVTEVTADRQDLELLFGPTPDFFNNIKGGSAAFKNKLLLSFDDPADSKRPQFSSDASAGAIVLAVDTGDLTDILKLLKQIANILKQKFEAQFLPPTNMTAIAGNASIRITYSPNDALLPNAFILWRSETRGGVPLTEEVDIPNSGDPLKKEKVSLKDRNGNDVTRYEFVKIMTVQEQIAEIFNVSIEDANNLIKNSFNYIRGVLANANQFFASKFTTEDEGLENGKPFFYVITAASVVDPNDVSKITGGLKTSDQIIWVQQADGTFIRETNPFDIGLYANGENSTEVSASPNNAFSIVQGSLARCRNYRCSTGKQTTEKFSVNQNDLDGTINKTLKNTPLVSTMDVTVERISDGATSIVDVQRSDYNVKGKVVTFLKTNFFELNDEIAIDYSYREILKTEDIEDESHIVSTATTTIVLKNVPIVDTSVKIRPPPQSFTVIDANKGKIQIVSALPPSGAIPYKINYTYYVDFDSDENFRCINPEFNKYYFDVVKCDDGSTLCPGFENRNCIFNNGELCSNTATSTRRIVVPETTTVTNNDKQTITKLTGRKISQPENITFKDFWDPFYCQNGIMAQRCDGFSLTAPRAGFKGVPPDWSRIAIIDLFPDIKDAILYLSDFINSLLAGTEKLGDTLIAFIELIQQKIQQLQDFLAFIQNLLDMISQNFSGAGFHILKVPLGEGGNAYLQESIAKATGGPTSDMFGYTGGKAIVYGGPGSATLEKALDIFF